MSIAQFESGCKKAGLGAGTQEYLQQLVLGDRHSFFGAVVSKSACHQGDMLRPIFSNGSRTKISRNYGLDLARILAAYMVMAGHLVLGGSVAIDRPYIDWAGKSEVLPLLSNNSLWKLDNYLLGHRIGDYRGFTILSYQRLADAANVGKNTRARSFY